MSLKYKRVSSSSVGGGFDIQPRVLAAQRSCPQLLPDKGLPTRQHSIISYKGYLEMKRNNEVNRMELKKLKDLGLSLELRYNRYREISRKQADGHHNHKLNRIL